MRLNTAKKNYKLTYAASVTGTFDQAFSSNIFAILFVPFSQMYGFGLWQLGVFVAVNFATQMLADVFLTIIIDKVPYRPLILTALAVSAAGILFFGMCPYIFSSGAMFAGLLAAIVIFAFAAGMLEVLISPIVENIPRGKRGKGAVMSIVHSCYAWGQVLTILFVTLFIVFAGYDKWNFAVMAFILVPLAAFFLFLSAPLDKKVPEKKTGSVKNVARSPYFIICCLAIMLGGGTEIIMNQYASTFTELALGFNKLVSDLVGMGLFAVFLGVGRLVFGLFGDRFNLNKVLMYSAFFSFVLFLTAALMPVRGIALAACVLCGITVSLLWPGTLVVTSSRFKQTGVWIFAVLAICGDVGASLLSLLTGFTADGIGFQNAIAVFSLVPLLCFFCHLYLYKSNKGRLLT